MTKKNTFVRCAALSLALLACVSLVGCATSASVKIGPQANTPACDACQGACASPCEKSCGCDSKIAVANADCPCGGNCASPCPNGCGCDAAKKVASNCPCGNACASPCPNGCGCSSAKIGSDKLTNDNGSAVVAAGFPLR